MSYYHQGLEGWSEFTELYRQWVDEAKEPAVFVEVGIWKGRSTIAMAEFIADAEKDIRFFAVDHFRGSAEYQDELRDTGIDLEAEFRRHASQSGVGYLIHVIDEPSVSAARYFQDGGCDLVYLDASHDTESVRADLATWWPKVRPGGFIAGHDWGGNWPGVTQAVTEFAEANGLEIQDLGSTWRIDKPC